MTKTAQNTAKTDGEQGGVRRLCINCDNRHGCATAAPLCESVERGPGEAYLAGKALMGRRGLLARCRRCGHFRQCWTAEAYLRARRS